MSVVSLFRNNSGVDMLRDSGYGDADFKVLKAPMTYSDTFGRTHKVDGKDMYYREDTGQQLAIHGKRYNAVQHTKMIDTSRNILERSSLNLNDVREDIQVGSDGAMCFVKHTLPDHIIETPDGDTACMTMLHINSFNGVWSYQGSAGVLQSACTNSQVFVGGAATIYKARHTNALNVEHGARLLNGILGIMDQQNNIWAEWAKRECGNREAFKHIAEAAGSKIALQMLHDGERIPEIIMYGKVNANDGLMYMWNKYQDHYSRKLGENYWSVYNVMTDWSSHHIGRRRKNAVDIPVAQLKKSEKVQEIITKAFPIAA